MREQLLRHFEQHVINAPVAGMPDKLEKDVVYLVKTAETYHRFRSYVAFKCIDVDSEWKCDYLLMTPDYYCHLRLFHTGELVKLENYEGQFGLPAYKDEKTLTKIRTHNENVSQILIAKGFLNAIGGRLAYTAGVDNHDE